MTTVHPAREVLPALLAFSDRFRGVVGAEHHVASPLGAGMLLAVAAAERLRGVTRDLVADPPTIETRGVPLLMLSVVATRATWVKPYGLLPATRLRRCSSGIPRTGWPCALPRLDLDWADRPTSGLHAEYGEGVRIVRSPVTSRPLPPDRGRSRGLLGDRPSERRAGVVLKAAHRIATATGQEVHTRSLFDLPLGDARCWSIRGRTERFAGTRENAEAVLPEWAARSTHGLERILPGFDAAAAGVGARCQTGRLPSLRRSRRLGRGRGE